jgi:hypothetical protein
MDARRRPRRTARTLRVRPTGWYYSAYFGNAFEAAGGAGLTQSAIEDRPAPLTKGGNPRSADTAAASGASYGGNLAPITERRLLAEVG